MTSFWYPVGARLEQNERDERLRIASVSKEAKKKERNHRELNSGRVTDNHTYYHYTMVPEAVAICAVCVFSLERTNMI